MAILVSDPSLEQRLLAERQASGANRFDEVWEGIYMMAPMPNDEHHYLVARIVYILEDVVGIPGLGQVRPGVNLSDRREDWEKDYRVPDVAVFLQDGTARNHGTHWAGAADFLVEIISPDDRTREKLPFYTGLGVRELLLIDRDPWSLELFARRGEVLQLIGQCNRESDVVLASSVVPLTFKLVDGLPRPTIDVEHVTTGRRWLV